MTSVKQVFDSIISNNAIDYGGKKKFLEAVYEHGAESIGVDGLIFYKDTDKIFDEHEDAFNDFLEYYCDASNVISPNEILFGWENRINSSSNKHAVVIAAFENYVTNLLEAIEDGTSTDDVKVF